MVVTFRIIPTAQLHQAIVYCLYVLSRIFFQPLNLRAGAGFGVISLPQFMPGMIIEM